VNNIKIKIVPLGEVNKKILEKIIEELKITYRMIGEVTNIEKLPTSAFNTFRNQYRSDELLNFLEKHYEGRILGITKEDLYTEGLNFVFGQAKMRGRVAIISICRLDPTFFHQPEDEEFFEKRIIKEVIHETGHMLGLGHCDKRACVMSFSNTVGDTDKKSKYLCDMCKLQMGI
jgi:archaemetzincin